jgi:ornithine carbamoyltransferase
MKDLLRMSDLSPTDAEVLIALTETFTRAPRAHPSVLAGELVVLFFDKPSTRTRLSFEAATARLGGVPIVVTRDELQLSRGEWLKDTARTFRRLARVLVMRTFEQSEVECYASECEIPVVNGLTDAHHPTQVIGDLATIRGHFGRLDGLKLAYVGDGNNIAHSLLEGGALAGMQVAVATPPEYYEPDPEVVGVAHALARRTGGSVEVGYDPHLAVKGADIVYTDEWISMNCVESQHELRREIFAPYRVDERLMEEAAPQAVFMHALPAHRGEEVTSEVIDGPRSLVLQQVDSGLSAAQAVLFALVKGRLRGSTG